MIDPAALAELSDAALYYRSHASLSISAAFVDEFERVCKLLLTNTELGSIWKNNIRHYPLRRFPFFIIYKVVSAELRIIAVAHQRRRPANWTKRR